MKRIFTVFWILIFSCCFSASSFGQDLLNILELRYCEIRDLEVDSEGNTIIAAIMSKADSLLIENNRVDMLYRNYTNRYYNMFVAKISPENKLLWISRGKTQTIDRNDNDERITVDLHINLDKFDNIYTLVSKSSYKGGYPEEIAWEDDTFERHNNLLFKLNSNGAMKWNKSWDAHNHPSLYRQFYTNYASRGSLLSVNKRGDILVASEVRPSNHKTIIDNDTIIVTHAGNNHTNRRWADPAMLLLRFDTNGKFQFHRSAVIEPYGKDINQPEYVTFKDIQIDEKGGFSVLSQINAHAFFSTGESIEEKNKESEVYLLKYDRFGNNMTYDKSYALTSKANLETDGSNTHINDFENTRLGNEYSISQRKMNENGQIISDIKTSFKSENTQVILNSNILTDNTDASYFMLKVFSNRIGNVKGTIYLDVKYELEAQSSPSERHGYYFFVKMKAGKVQSSSLYDIVDEDNYGYNKRSPRTIQLRKDDKGSIYFHDSYLSNSIILGRTMPRNISHPSSEKISCFVVTLDSKYIILSNEEELLQSKYVNVYPNPSNSVVNIELDELEVSEVILTNNLGVEVQTTKIINSDKITLDLENLSNGIYFVKIVSQKGIFYKKVVLKK